MGPTVLLIAGLASASAVGVVLPTERAPDPAKLERHLRIEVARPELSLHPAESLAEADGIRDALLAHPNECEPDLSEDQLGALADLHQHLEDELYIALAVSNKAKDTALWRYDPTLNTLLRVFGSAGPVAPVNPEPSDIRLLLWPQTDEQPTDLRPRDLVAVGAGTLTAMGPDPDLLNALTRQPEACWPELGDDALAKLDALQSDAVGPVVLAVVPPKGPEVLFWRWDAGQRRLSRISAD